MANVVSIERLNEDNTRQTLDDGSVQIVNQHGQNYFDRDAQAFLGSDSTIQPDAMVPGFTHNAKAGSARARLAPGGRFRFGLKYPLYVTYAPRGANAVPASVFGNKAQFQGLWPNTDVTLTKFPEGMKEDLILLDASAPSSYIWDLEEIAGVVPTPATDGGLDYVETLTGQIVGRIPAPTVHDAAGVEGTATLTYVAGAITIATDPAWQADPARVFPVTLDPTTYTVQPDPTAGKDAYTLSSSPTTNYGTNTALVIGNDGAGGGNYWRSFIQLAMPSIAGQGVTSASLQLNGSAGGLTLATIVRAITATWGEATITHGNQPTVSGSAAASASAVTGWSSWDITALVKAWIAGTQANYGVRLAMESFEGSTTQAGDFTAYSSDYVTDTSLRPKLVITATAAPTPTLTNPTGASSSAPTIFTNDVTPTLTGTYSSADSVAQAKYRFRIYDAVGNLVADQGLQTGTANSWAVPLSAALKYGVPYQVTLYVEDANGGYATSAAKWMQFAMSAPTGLGATPTPGSARIDLAWDPHPGENLAGYRVYRRETGASTWNLFSIGTVPAVTTDVYYFLNAQQISLVVETLYHDRIPETDVTYEYQVAAVATDGYESPASALSSAAVTVSGFWVDDTQVHLTEAPVFEYPRRASARTGTDGSWLIQDLGQLGRRLRLSLQFRSRAEREALRALFPAGHQISYRDQEGNTFRGAAIGTISEQRIQRSSEFYGALQMEAVEVAP